MQGDKKERRAEVDQNFLKYFFIDFIIQIKKGVIFEIYLE